MDISGKSKLPPDKIGAETSILDVAWKKSPKNAIINAHKLTEVELLSLL